MEICLTLPPKWGIMGVYHHVQLQMPWICWLELGLSRNRVAGAYYRCVSRFPRRVCLLLSLVAAPVFTPHQCLRVLSTYPKPDFVAVHSLMIASCTTFNFHFPGGWKFQALFCKPQLLFWKLLWAPSLHWQDDGGRGVQLFSSLPTPGCPSSASCFLCSLSMPHNPITLFWWPFSLLLGSFSESLCLCFCLEMFVHVF